MPVFPWPHLAMRTHCDHTEHPQRAHREHTGSVGDHVGVLEDVDGIFGIHNWPTMPLGKVGSRAHTLMAGSAEFSINIIGRGGHAALPQGNIDPVIPTAALVTAFQVRLPHPLSLLTAIQGPCAWALPLRQSLDVFADLF